MCLRPGRRKQLQKYQDGQIPSDFFYGFVELSSGDKRFVLDEFEYPAHIKRNGTVFRAWQTLDKALSFFCLCNLRLRLAIGFFKKLVNRELVITNIDSIGLSIALIRFLHPIPQLHLHISQGLTNELESQKGRNQWKWEIRRVLSTQLLKQMDAVVVLGEGAARSLVEYGLVSRDRLKTIQFGVDTNFWNPGGIESEEKSYLLSVGSDAGRDFDTLLKSKPPLPCKLVTRRTVDLTGKNELFDKVENLTDEALRDIYRKARFVIVTLQDIPQPSGQSVSLQAMACGTPVLITRTKGFWHPEKLGEGDGIFFIPNPGDVVSLQQMMDKLCCNNEDLMRAGKQAVEAVSSRYSMERFAQKLKRISDVILENSKRPAV